MLGETSRFDGQAARGFDAVGFACFRCIRFAGDDSSGINTPLVYAGAVPVVFILPSVHAACPLLIRIP
jgi:hypothetical protein